MTIAFVLSLVYLIHLALAGPATESYKDQFCTDPRTMRKHAAYTEWADAYSCTRHRCQPGGRNLAIYTVGCKRVEAPESAIECEEVVEDTNMQFPYCCTRLRCLVVVRGEVWTRVLGQPWEALPAAPWSHMYKMKRPPPADGSFLPKTAEVGPVYELAETDRHDKLRRDSADTRDTTDCNEVKPAVAPAPDIVIALSTGSKDQQKSSDDGDGRMAPRYLALRAGSRLRRQHKPHMITTSATYYDEAGHESDTALDIQEFPTATTEKPQPVVMKSGDEASSDEKYYANSFGVTQKIKKAAAKVDPWTEIPTNQWNEHDPVDAADSKMMSDHDQDLTWTVPDVSASKDLQKDPPPSNLQSLVDAIGTRMRDIESVVQRMSDKVHDATPDRSGEKRRNADSEVPNKKKPMKASPDSDKYKRFSVRERGSKYLLTSEPTTDIPLFIEDNHMGTGYFSDASNSVLRRAGRPKEPAETYMAPVETKRKQSTDMLSEDETDKKHKKHAHKKKSKRTHKKQKRSKEEKTKRFNKMSSAEKENIVSLEDSSIVGS